MADETVTVDPMDNPDLVPPMGTLGDSGGLSPFVDADGFVISGPE
jgi:hypothetical protein